MATWTQKNIQYTFLLLEFTDILFIAVRFCLGGQKHTGLPLPKFSGETVLLVANVRIFWVDFGLTLTFRSICLYFGSSGTIRGAESSNKSALVPGKSVAILELTLFWYVLGSITSKMSCCLLADSRCSGSFFGAFQIDLNLIVGPQKVQGLGFSSGMFGLSSKEGFIVITLKI